LSDRTSSSASGAPSGPSAHRGAGRGGRAGRRVLRHLSAALSRRMAGDRTDERATVGPGPGSSGPAAAGDAGPLRGHVMTAVLRIDAPGPHCTVQDLGRPGYAQLGVGRSGAADRGALIRANRLVGNVDGAAALEITLGGLRLTALTGCRIAVAGAALSVSVDGDPREGDGPLDVGAGQRVRLGRPARGLRSYLSVRG